MAKFRALFFEEATEHLAEMSRALLELEKDSASVESIDLVFRMAHSIKSMAASVGYEAIAEVSHALEDRMQQIRSAGRIDTSEDPEVLSSLFHGLEGLERMVDFVHENDAAPEADAELVARLQTNSSAPDVAATADRVAQVIADVECPPRKKVLS
ncbi:MAG: Hpt domain-containing protein [Myxococcota bacterium]|nr:Hpt domain-containing protein [Myxococcota bacterium]